MKIPPIALKAGLLVVLFSLVSGGLAFAQDPGPGLTPVPSVTETPTGPISTPASAEAAVPAPAPSTAQSPRWIDSLFQQKLPIDVGFRLGEAYSDNIFFQPKKTEDYITTLSPTIDFVLGAPIPLAPELGQETIDDRTTTAHANYFAITYHPTLTLYAKNSFLDDVDEYVDTVYTHQFARLTLSLGQSYEKLSQPTVQINTEGTLIHRDIYTTTANANYIYSDQLSTYGTFTQTTTVYTGNAYTDNTEWVGDYYFLYQLQPKLSMGLGPRIGFDDVDRSPNQAFQAALFHLNYVATGKFAVGGAAGAEVREFEHDSAPTEVTPIVEGVATYQPFDSMTIKLDGERHRIVSDGQAGSDYTASVASLELRQRFFQVVYLTLAGGYEDDQYTNFVGEDGPTRDDDIYFARCGLEWKSYRGLTIDAGYEYLDVESNIKAFTFDENRITVSATIKY